MDPNIPVTPTPADPAAFIARWQKSGAAERANYQLFLSELCDVLGVPRPDPTTPDDAAIGQTRKLPDGRYTGRI